MSVCWSASEWDECRSDASSVGVPGGALCWDHTGRPALDLQVHSVRVRVHFLHSHSVHFVLYDIVCEGAEVGC